MSYSPLFFGSVANAPSSGTSSDYTNGTVSTITMATPVSSNGSGQISPTDVSSEASIQSWVGLAAISIASSASGQIASDGRLQNIPIGLGFSVGDPIWLGLSGTLTNVKPDMTVLGWSSGDWVVFVGVIVQNQFDMTKQDIQILRQVIGQL